MGSDFGVIRYSSDVGFSLVLSVPLCMRKSCLVSTWIQGYPGSGAGRAEWIFFQARHQLRYVDSALDTLDLIFRTANKQSHVNQVQSCSAGFQAHEGLRRLLVDLQQNWVHKPHPEFPAREDVGNEAGLSEGLAGFLLDFLPGTTAAPLRLQMFCTTLYI